MKYFFYLIKRKLGNLLYKEVKVNLQANEQLKKEKNQFCSAQNDPHFYLLPENESLSKWIRLKILLKFDFIGKPYLYYDCGAGYSELDKMTLPIDLDGHIDYLLRLPDGCRQVRFDPMDQEGCFELTLFKCYRVPKAIVLVIFLRQQMVGIIKQVIAKKAFFKRNFLYCIRHIFAERLSKGINLLSNEPLNLASNYTHWLHYNERLLLSRLKSFKTNDIQSKLELIIVIVLPDYDAHYIKNLKQSLQAQNYSYWKAVIVSTEKNTENSSLVNNDKRFHFIESEVASMGDKCNKLITEMSQKNREKQQIVVFLASGIYLNPMALLLLAEQYVKEPFKVAYADEDFMDEQGRRFEPIFKPDWDPFLLRGQNYFGGMISYEADFFIQIGGIQQPLDFYAYWELALRASRLTDAKKIVHISAVLSHRDNKRYCSGEVSYAEPSCIKNILAQHLVDLDAPAIDISIEKNGTNRIQYELKRKPLVSIIIPTKNGYHILKQCIDSIFKLTSYSDYEIIVIDNQSDENKSLDYLKSLQNNDKVRVIKYDKPFNYSAINNYAVEYAQGDVLLFLNNDVEVINADWLTEMLQLVTLSNVGAVGAKLLFSNESIQHAGVILGYQGVAGHLYSGSEKDLVLPLARTQVVQSYTAVTAACLAVKKVDFLAVDGFNEQDLAVAFNDVDFCLKLHQSGLNNLWTPYAQLYHYESLSRGNEDSPEKLARFAKEIAYMKKTWSIILPNDPMYNGNLSLQHLEFQFAEQTRFSI